MFITNNTGRRFFLRILKPNSAFCSRNIFPLVAHQREQKLVTLSTNKKTKISKNIMPEPWGNQVYNKSYYQIEGNGHKIFLSYQVLNHRSINYLIKCRITACEHLCMHGTELVLKQKQTRTTFTVIRGDATEQLITVASCFLHIHIRY